LKKYLNVEFHFLKTTTLEYLLTFGLGLGEGDRTLLTNHVTEKAE
jgi:hypothetical protein